jgi:MerR family copper efflux transcriptional regulator
MGGFTIGEVAEQAKAHIETLRYYEWRGLVARPPRSASNYPLYPEDAVRRVRFIRRAQELGFSLKEIQEVLFLRAAPEAECGEIRAHAEAKIKDIDEKIGSLMAMMSALSKLVTECSGEGPLYEAARCGEPGKALGDSLSPCGGHQRPTGRLLCWARS